MDEWSAVSDAMWPIGVGDQRSSHRDKVTISAFQPGEEWDEVVFGQAALAAHHLGHRVVECDRADGNGRLSRQLLGPSRKICLRAELTLPIPKPLTIAGTTRRAKSLANCRFQT